VVDVLTAIGQVRHLEPAEAARGLDAVLSRLDLECRGALYVADHGALRLLPGTQTSTPTSALAGVTRRRQVIILII
jgi:hypothetical protein